MRKLTLISAPAGFGKTTLLSEWVGSCGRPVAWVSVDKGANAPIRFWRYVVAALQTVVASVGEAAQVSATRLGHRDGGTLHQLSFAPSYAIIHDSDSFTAFDP